MFETPKGIKDRDELFLLKEMAIIKEFHNQSRKLGCGYVVLAPVGYSEIYKKGANTTGDKTYNFLDRSGRELMLNPDSTPAYLRWYLKKTNGTVPERIFFKSPIFRYRNRTNRYYHHLGLAFINEQDNESGFDFYAYILIKTVTLLLAKLDIPINIVVGHFGLLRQILSDLNNTINIDQVLNTLRPLDLKSRDEWLKQNTDREAPEVSALIMLFSKESFLIEEFQALKAKLMIKDKALILVNQLVDFCAALKSLNANVSITCYDLRSSELQNGIFYKIYNNTKKIGDGGCYNFYGSKFDSRVNSLKSIAVVLEDITDALEDSSFKIDRGYPIIISDCSLSYFDDVTRMLSSININSIPINAPANLNKSIGKCLTRYPCAILIGKNEEVSRTIKIINRDPTKTLVINYNTDISLLAEHLQTH